MTTARDIMTADAECIGANESALLAAHKMADLGVLAQGQAVTIGADDDASEILRTMSEHHVRRLPVIDGHTLVGMVAQADVARALLHRNLFPRRHTCPPNLSLLAGCGTVPEPRRRSLPVRAGYSPAGRPLGGAWHPVKPCLRREWRRSGEGKPNEEG